MHVHLLMQTEKRKCMKQKSEIHFQKTLNEIKTEKKC